MSNQAVAFTHVDEKNVKRSTFDLSHFHLTSQRHGELLPVFCEEVLPGDNFQLKTNVLARYMPLINPPMSPLKLQVHYFYVRNTHMMKNWENFMLQRKENGVDVQLPTIPSSYLSIPEEGEGPFRRILDRLGFPTKAYDVLNPAITSIVDYPDDTFSALPLLAYYKVWIDYFVDQNLDPAFETYMSNNYDDGITSDSFAQYISDLTNGGTTGLKYRAWESDYFTSMLPWPQRGNAVLLPLDVELDGLIPAAVFGAFTYSGSPQSGDITADGSGNLLAGATPVVLSGSADLEEAQVDITQEATINDLRYSIRLQKFLENNARVGMRYAQRMAYEFDVNEKYLDDHRSVYLGDFTQRVQISEVPQTSSTVTTGDDASPQGNLAANASVFGSEHNFDFTAPDHGFIIGIASIITEPMYSQGIRKKFLRRTPMDYYRPEFEGIGEQPVLNIELMYQPTTDLETGTNLDTLGYLPYGSDLRTIYSYYTGDMRTYFLDWHLGRVFDTNFDPRLNTDLVYTANEDFSRIFAVQDDSDNVLLHFHFDLKATRPISVFGTPASL